MTLPLLPYLPITNVTISGHFNLRFYAALLLPITIFGICLAISVEKFWGMSIVVLFVSITNFGICLAISIGNIWGISIVVLFLSIIIFVFVWPFPMRMLGT